MGKFESSASLPWYKASDRNAATLQLSPKPTYDQLPVKYGIHHSWSYFGKDDELGTINFLTPDVVAAAGREIQDGTMVSLNLPIQLPAHPYFGRPAASAAVITRDPKRPVNDDIIHMNTQSGTQTDGLKHFGCFAGNCFYNDTPVSAIKAGELSFDDPLDIANDDIKLGVHNWQAHGIAGRGVLLDLVAYYTRNGEALPYDSWKRHEVPLADVQACAAYQDVEFRQGDHVLIRFGWTLQYWHSSSAEKLAATSGAGAQFAGLTASDETAAWIWNNGFASVSGDNPALEAWPVIGQYLHERVIAGFGCPIGEFYDLERLSEVCQRKKRWTFYYASNLTNILGGCASTANASATF